MMFRLWMFDVFCRKDAASKGNHSSDKVESTVVRYSIEVGKVRMGFCDWICSAMHTFSIIFHNFVRKNYNSWHLLIIFCQISYLTIRWNLNICLHCLHSHRIINNDKLLVAIYRFQLLINCMFALWHISTSGYIVPRTVNTKHVDCWK